MDASTSQGRTEPPAARAEARNGLSLRVPRRNRPCQHLDARLLASGTVENECLLFQLPGLWSRVTAAPGNEHKQDLEQPCARHSVALQHVCARRGRKEPMKGGELERWGGGEREGGRRSSSSC